MKRRALKLLIFLLLGAIINVAVAWGCAIAFRSLTAAQHDASAFESYVYWRVFVSSRRVETTVFSERLRGDFHTASKLHPNDILPSWAPFEMPTAKFKNAGEDDDALENRLTVARGFPMLSLRSERAGVGDIQKSPSLDLVHGIETSLDWPSTGNVIMKLDLPTWPVWPGFAINTIFYAAIVWALLAVPGMVKRRRRIRRGLCVGCGYPLGSSPVCSECGTPLFQRDALHGVSAPCHPPLEIQT